MDGNVGVALRRWGALLATCGLLILACCHGRDARAAVGDVLRRRPLLATWLRAGDREDRRRRRSVDRRHRRQAQRGDVRAGAAVGGVLQLANGGPALSSSIVRIDIASGLQTFTSQNGLMAEPKGIVLAASGVEAYVADQTVAQILIVNLATGAQAVVTSGNLLDTPRDVTIGKDGNLYVSDAGAGQEVIRVNPANGAQSPVTDAGELTNLQGITSGPNGDLFVADFDAQVVRVNPATGVQQKAAEGGTSWARRTSRSPRRVTCWCQMPRRSEAVG